MKKRLVGYEFNGGAVPLHYTRKNKEKVTQNQPFFLESGPCRAAPGES
jgi:hypothetical protein